MKHFNLVPLVLASGSPRRKQLLELAEIPFEIITAATAEDFPPGMPATAVPIHIARNKALAVREKFALHGRTILAADTIVVLNNAIIGKPAGREDAINIISRLSGQTHEVITGVVLLHGEAETAFTETSSVTFHSLTPEQITYYVDTYQPFDKAGAYAIQEWIGVVGISGITGDFYNVMGLPVSRVVRLLNDM